MAAFNRLTITLADPSESAYKYQGSLEIDDGRIERFIADSREQIIAQASEFLQRLRDLEEADPEPEVLILDEVGEIVREPVEFSVKVR